MNRLILQRVAERHRKANPGGEADAVQAIEQGLVITPAGSEAYTLVWKDITRIAAFRIPNFVGDTLALVFEFQNEYCLTLTEDMVGWSDVSRNLPIYLPGALPYEGWSLSAAFDNGRNEPVWVYQRPAAS